jgi:FkbM family methyltransferase
MNSYIESIDFSRFSSVKLDIGLSYNAPHSNMWLEQDNTGKLLVIGFEPNPDSVTCIQNKNIMKLHPAHSTPIQDKYIGTNFHLIPVALSNVEHPTTMDFYAMSGDVGVSSLYKPTYSGLGGIKEIIKVPVYSLKHFFDVFPWDKIDKVDYIKIDAQGADLDILKGAGDYLKERVVFITAEPECRQYENCHHNSDTNITEYLRSQGFERIHHMNTVDPTFINMKYISIAHDIFIAQVS